ncbi:UbiA family prenyltransferase [Actinomadura rupiterrae]|uniref:UbiA family prenyltransferase n=1 Tax=Actinomadura rupiterrae TaxID=559627 RepID=UPI0020A55246|nr:UbiA family prenyltransferase [Actinomadura rupiterrae]MCP2339598.1 chlorophyll synthase [Actinomadura rupiterrae]
MRGLVRDDPVLRAGRVLGGLWVIARPALWLVSWVPFGLGQMLAARELVAGQRECLPRPRGCADAVTPVLTGVVVWGPLVWLAVLAVNDAVDLPGDRKNPRKRDAPLVSGRLSVRTAIVAAHVAAVAAVLAAATVRVSFALVTLGFLGLGWLYSVPPFRFKARPGLDVATNAVAYGGLALVAGWTAVRPPAGFPWVISFQGVLVAVAFYVPTTVADHGADVASGYRTVAVRLGPRAAQCIGFAALAAACALAILLAARDQLYPNRILWITVASAPVLLGAYWRLLVRARGPHEVLRGIIVLSWLFLVPCAAFALTYTRTL